MAARACPLEAGFSEPHSRPLVEDRQDVTAPSTGLTLKGRPVCGTCGEDGVHLRGGLSSRLGPGSAAHGSAGPAVHHGRLQAGQGANRWYSDPMQHPLARGVGVDCPCYLRTDGDMPISRRTPLRAAPVLRTGDRRRAPASRVPHVMKAKRECGSSLWMPALIAASSASMYSDAVILLPIRRSVRAL